MASPDARYAQLLADALAGVRDAAATTLHEPALPPSTSPARAAAYRAAFLRAATTPQPAAAPHPFPPAGLRALLFPVQEDETQPPQRASSHAAVGGGGGELLGFSLMLPLAPPATEEGRNGGGGADVNDASALSSVRSGSSDGGGGGGGRWQPLVVPADDSDDDDDGRPPHDADTSVTGGVGLGDVTAATLASLSALLRQEATGRSTSLAPAAQQPAPPSTPPRSVRRNYVDACVATDDYAVAVAPTHHTAAGSGGGAATAVAATPPPAAAAAPADSPLSLSGRALEQHAERMRGIDDALARQREALRHIRAIAGDAGARAAATGTTVAERDGDGASSGSPVAAAHQARLRLRDLLALRAHVP